jgi:hypothetical protein
MDSATANNLLEIKQIREMSEHCDIFYKHQFKPCLLYHCFVVEAALTSVPVLGVVQDWEAS